MKNRSLISQKDFFISYSSPDRLWAEWIAWQLKKEGYTVNHGCQVGRIAA